MPTRAQIKANRKNAKKSTGPRTEEGKTRSAKNALKHGLLARDTVMPGEDPADFDRQLSALEADIQPANSLEFELVRQIADAQWRMRRLTRLETGFLAAAVDDQRRHLEKRRPDELRPGYDGETLLLGSAMLDRTQAFVHLARYDGHLSRRFFRAVKQLRDLRRDERKAQEARSSVGSHAPADPYRSRYVPAQAPPPIDPPSPTANRIGFRVSSESAPQPTLTQTTKQTQFPPTPVKSAPFKDEPCSADLAFEIRGLCFTPRWEPTFPLRERVRFFCGAHSQCATSRLISTPGSRSNDQTNPIAPNSHGNNNFSANGNRAPTAALPKRPPGTAGLVG